MNYEYFDLHKLVDDIIEQFEDKAEKKEIDLSCRTVGEVQEINVYADWQRIKQVLVNLISNAINYTNSGGKVLILLSKSYREIEVKVKDDGIGIPEEDIGRIFERFYRVDKSRSRTHGGTGLGLAIVKHILDGHKTTISVKSEVGRGTEFKFNLPMEEGLLY